MRKEKTNNQTDSPQAGFTNRIFHDGGTVASVLGTLNPGDELLMGNHLYNLSAEHVFRTSGKLGISVRQTDMSDTEKLLGNISEKTRMIWIESPSGPTLRISDMNIISATAHKHHITLVMDNTLGAPLLQDPTNLGVDYLIHRRVPSLKNSLKEGVEVVLGRTPQLGTTEHHQPVEGEEFAAPFFKTSEKWFQRYGEEIDRLTRNTNQIAQFLEESSSVAKVYYPGRPCHPDFSLAKKYQVAPGNLLSFYLKEDNPEAAERVLRKTKIFNTAIEPSGEGSLISNPSGMSLAHFPAFMKRRAGIRDSLLWLYIGKEPMNQLIDDLEGAL